MAKKKFAIRSLFSGRAAKTVPDADVAEYASDSDELVDAHPFDPTQVNRPPKLDDRIEAELRRACAVVVENLKPSGYDLEDTRMQSDILVDNPNLDNAKYFPPRPKPTITVPQPDATWYLDASTRSSQFVNPRSVVKSPDKRGSTYRISGIASDYDSSHIQDHPLPHHPIENTESPRAPLASGALPSRNLASPLPKQVGYVKSVLDPNNHSSSSAPSDNDPASATTTAASTTYTPSSTSKRASDNAKPDAQGPSAVSGPGPWMKQEVDKRTNAERNSHNAVVTRDSNLPTDDSTSIDNQNVEEAHTVSARSGHMIGSGRQQVKLTDVRAPNTQTSFLTQSPQLDDANQPVFTSGTLSGPFEQPQLVSDMPEEDDKTSNMQALSLHDNENVRSPKSQDSAQLAEDYQKSFMPDQIPSVPVVQDRSTSPTRAKTSSTNSRRVSNNVNRPISTSSQKSDGSKRGSKTLSPAAPLSPGLPKSPQTWPAPPKSLQSEDDIPQIPPIPDKHQLDESIVVKDFYKPSGVPRVGVYRRSGNPGQFPTQPGDVEAADFDSFMSVVKHSSRPDTATSKSDQTLTSATAVKQPDLDSSASEPSESKKSESSTPVATSRPISSKELPPLPPPPAAAERIETHSATESYLESNNDDAEEAAHSVSHSRLESHPPSAQDLKTSATTDSTSNQSISQEVEVKDFQQNQQQQPVSSILVTTSNQETSSPAIVSSSRTSISTPVPASSHSRSASTSKRNNNRGLKRFLSKLGNNDRTNTQINGYSSSKRKYVHGYAPGAYVPGHGINGGIEENDEWFDEQACAAPVVGFGRGW